MGKTRVCGGTCHKAKGTKCRCWCGGTFHGPAGEAARAEYVATFSVQAVPNTEREFLETTGQANLFSGRSVADDWRDRLERARARGTSSKPVAEGVAL